MSLPYPLLSDEDPKSMMHDPQLFLGGCPHHHLLNLAPRPLLSIADIPPRLLAQRMCRTVRSPLGPSSGGFRTPWIMHPSLAPPFGRPGRPHQAHFMQSPCPGERLPQLPARGLGLMSGLSRQRLGLSPAQWEAPPTGSSVARTSVSTPTQGSAHMPCPVIHSFTGPLSFFQQMSPEPLRALRLQQ